MDGARTPTAMPANLMRLEKITAILVEVLLKGPAARRPRRGLAGHPLVLARLTRDGQLAAGALSESR